MEHDITLNIHYTAPDKVWEKINSVYSSMPYWAENAALPHWAGDDIDLYASVEPGGIQISGTMPESLWNDWYDTLKRRLTEALGYEIGEPEEGFRFKFWEPFKKNYSDIKSVDSKAIVFNDYSTFYLNEFDKIERDIAAKPPYFLLSSEFIELYIYFSENGIFSKRKNKQYFHDFQAKLVSLGFRTFDMS